MQQQRSLKHSLGSVVAINFFFFAILVGLWDLVFVFNHYFAFPFGDHWIWLARLYERGLAGALASQYNEHRLVLPGLFYFLDHRFFGSRNAFLIVVSMLLQTGCILLLVIPMWRSPGVPAPLRWVFSGFVVIAMFWFIQGDNFFVAMQLALACANLCILATLHIFSNVAAGESGEKSRAWGTTAAMLCCAAGATFSFGHGLLIWPILLASGAASRLRSRVMLAIALSATFVVVLYFVGYHTPAGQVSPVESMRNPVKVIQYMLLMLGLPFFGVGSHNVDLTTHVGSYALMATALLFAVAILVRFMWTQSDHKDPEQLIYCPLLLCSLVAAFVTALGRSYFPVDQALSGRYVHITLLFWISLIALTSIWLSRAEAGGGLGRSLWCAVLMLTSVATLSTQTTQGRYFATRERDQQAAAMSITISVPDTARIDEELARYDLVAFVERNAKRYLGRSLFARRESEWLGTPLTSHFRVAGRGMCLGVVDSVSAFTKPSPRGVRLVGWVWAAAKPAKRIWVVDDEMTVRGLGITRILRLDVAAAYGPAMESAGWIAYAQVPDARALTVFAELQDGGSVCQVGAPRTPD